MAHLSNLTLSMQSVTESQPWDHTAATTTSDNITDSPMMMGSLRNTLTDSLENPLKSKLPWEADIGIAIYLGFIAFFTFLLNAMVLLTVAKRKRRSSPLEIYVINLAVVDIFPSSTFILDITSLVSHRGTAGIIGCKLSATLVYFCGIADISTVALMGLMTLVKSKSEYGKLVDHKLVQLSLPLIYINAFFWSVTPHLGWAAYAIEPYGITCTLEWNAMPLSYLVSVFSVNYVIPAVTMAALFCSIMPSLCGSTVFTSPTYRHDMYLSRLTFAMFVGFMVAWSPYAIVSFLYYFYTPETFPVYISVLAPLFSKSCNVYNPIIYCLVMKQFRRDMKKILLPWKAIRDFSSSQLVSVSYLEVIRMLRPHWAVSSATNGSKILKNDAETRTFI